MIKRNTLRQMMFWAAVILIVIVNLFAYRSLNDLMAVGRQADAAQYSLYQLERIGSLLKDAETGQRGYLLSGDEAYLEPYRLAVTEIPSALLALRDMLADDPLQRDRAVALEDLVRGQMAALAQGVAAQRGEGPASVDSAALAGGKAGMDAIRDSISEMTATEQGVVTALNRQANGQARTAVLLLAGGTIFSLAAIIVVFLWTTGQVKRRHALQHELSALNEELEERVALRTAELADANAALRDESEKRIAIDDSLRDNIEILNAVIGSTPLAVILLDGLGRVAVWNAAAERIFGYGHAETLGRSPMVKGRGIEGNEVDLLDLAAAAGAQGCDAELTRKDGKTIHARVLAAPIVAQRLPRRMAKDAQTSTASLLILIEDTTARNNIEQQLRQAQKMDVIGQLTGGVAHDFNNLLTIIVGNGDLALERLEDGSDLADYLKTMLRAAARGSELTQRLLAFARKQTLRPRVVDVNSLLPGISTMLKRVLGENISVSSLPARDIWPALVDPSQVEDAILNLAINARDAMPNGGQLVIETRNVSLDDDYIALNPEAVRGDYVMFSVTDTGVGIPSDVIEHVFEPFFTTKEMGKGTGLGLSMIYGFVKQSGGHIKIYSEVGYGTTVRIYLPRAKPGDGNLALAPTHEAPVPSGRETVLVVEDNIDVRRVAVRIMKELGYGVIEAETADQANEMLEKGAAVDVLFTDIVMPGKLTGYDLAKIAIKRNPHLKVLFTSGYSEVFMRQGADGVRAELISKPYRKQELALRLRAAIDAVD